MKKTETEAEAKTRISEQLKLEIQAYQKQGLPNEMIALKVYAALIDSRFNIEQLKVEVKRLADQVIHLHKVLDKEVKDMLLYGKTNKP